MRRLSEKLTGYIIKTGVVSEESYAIYQYGFQIGLEMLWCFVMCLSIALYLRMIPEFIVFTGIFILLRTYAGGVHLDSFWACFICSISVQTLVLLIDSKYSFPILTAWGIILVSAILILKSAPVENVNRELDSEEKEHCRKVTAKIIIGIFIIAGCGTLGGINKMVSLISLTVLVVLVSQYIGIIKYKVDKSKN